jgi:hypothetical protein
MNNKILKATHNGTLNIVGNYIQCYVLENKKRIISEGGMINIFQFIVNNDTRYYEYIENIFEKKDIKEEKIEFYFKNKKLYGFNAEYLTNILVMIAKSYSEKLEKNKKLKEIEEIILKNTENLLDSFCGVGYRAFYNEKKGIKTKKGELENLFNGIYAYNE